MTRDPRPLLRAAVVLGCASALAVLGCGATPTEAQSSLGGSSTGEQERPGAGDPGADSPGTGTRQDAVAYAWLLAERAHAAGLAMGQKNAAELTDAEIRSVGFDLAVAEDCQRHGWEDATECERYMAVHGENVIEIEYSDAGSSAFEAACRARGDRISILLRDRDVVPRGTPGYENRTC